MSNISDVEPSSFEEVDKLQVWKDAMLKEYMSIIKNNVWDIVLEAKRQINGFFQMDLYDQTCS
jgi:hypothetical protein